MSSVPEKAAQAIPVIEVNHEEVHKHLDQVVRDSVEATLNALLGAEADELCGPKRYERTAERLDTRAGHYSRKLQTRAGEVELKVPKLRNLPFETAIIERYRRRETSVEEALVEMYQAGQANIDLIGCFDEDEHALELGMSRSQMGQREY
jgi:transposase-like protein